jgi:hypothetical protein
MSFAIDLQTVSLKTDWLFSTQVSLESLSLPSGLVTSTGRPWLVDLWALEPRFILLATIPALMLASLLFMDQVLPLSQCRTHVLNELTRGFRGPMYHQTNPPQADQGASRGSF